MLYVSSKADLTGQPFFLLNRQLGRRSKYVEAT